MWKAAETGETGGFTALAYNGFIPDVVVEASGGIDEENISSYCVQDVDVISTSKLIQGYPAVDFSLKIIKKNS